MGRRGCASAMGMIKFPSSCSSPKALCNQFIDYYICSRGVFCINHIKLRNFVVITIECSIATVDRGSIMTRIYRWSMMVYSSLQAEFMVTKYDGHIHRYGALVFGKLVIYVSKSIDNNNVINDGRIPIWDWQTLPHISCLKSEPLLCKIVTFKFPMMYMYKLYIYIAYILHIDGLVQEWCNSIANSLELRLEDVDFINQHCSY